MMVRTIIKIKTMARTMDDYTACRLSLGIDKFSGSEFRVKFTEDNFDYYIVFILYIKTHINLLSNIIFW